MLAYVRKMLFGKFCQNDTSSNDYSSRREICTVHNNLDCSECTICRHATQGESESSVEARDSSCKKTESHPLNIEPVEYSDWDNEIPCLSVSGHSSRINSCATRSMDCAESSSGVLGSSLADLKDTDWHQYCSSDRVYLKSRHYPSDAAVCCCDRCNLTREILNDNKENMLRLGWPRSAPSYRDSMLDIYHDNSYQNDAFASSPAKVSARPTSTSLRARTPEVPSLSETGNPTASHLPSNRTWLERPVQAPEFYDLPKSVRSSMDGEEGYEESQRSLERHRHCPSISGEVHQLYSPPNITIRHVDSALNITSH